MPDARSRRASDHVARFNAAVRTGDWASFARTFADDAVMTFEGVPVPPARGRAAVFTAVLTASEARPPDDTLRVVEVVGFPADPAVDVVRFVWSRGGGTPCACAGVATSSSGSR